EHLLLERLEVTAELADIGGLVLVEAAAAGDPPRLLGGVARLEASGDRAQVAGCVALTGRRSEILLEDQVLSVVRSCRSRGRCVADDDGKSPQPHDHERAEAEEAANPGRRLHRLAIVGTRLDFTAPPGLP